MDEYLNSMSTCFSPSSMLIILAIISKSTKGADLFGVYEIGIITSIVLLYTYSHLVACYVHVCTGSSVPFP